MNKNGDLNLPHAHDPVAIAGVYYVSPGFNHSSDVGTGGVHFLRPGTSNDDILQNVVMATQLDQNGLTLPPIAPYDGHWTSPKLGRAGTLALWPGRLRHWVPPHSGDELRTSIAFNVELTLGNAEADGNGSMETSDANVALRTHSTAEQATQHAAAWDCAKVAAWLRDTLQLLDVAEAVAVAGVDGKSMLAMDKSAWKQLGASGLQSAKIAGEISKLKLHGTW